MVAGPPLYIMLVGSEPQIMNLSFVSSGQDDLQTSRGRQNRLYGIQDQEDIVCETRSAHVLHRNRWLFALAKKLGRHLVIAGIPSTSSYRISSMINAKRNEALGQP